MSLTAYFPSNIFFPLQDQRVKLGDFGSCRSVISKQPYTEYISTRWYRAPECVLTDGYYNYKMDIWSIGCVMYEIMTLHPLFPGANEVDQVRTERVDYMVMVRGAVVC